MSNDVEKLFWQLYNCNGEDEVHAVVNDNPLLSDLNNWQPYADTENNFATFENQMANPVPALIEKLTNSIDALLLKECKVRNITPESNQAPKTMAEAVEQFFNIKNGDFSEVFHHDRRRIAEHIQLIASGDKTRPDLTVYDDGEGQHPDEFPTTFLSLLRGNKKKINFVQGKYNMGSTGAVVFCGEYKYQLIGSKKSSDGKANEFGFTLIRRHPLTAEEEENCKSTWYEYFVIGGKVPRYIMKTADMGLYNREFSSGSIVKMYSYQIPRGCGSTILWDLWRELNIFLYHPALPVLLYEKRYPKQKTPSKPVLGNKTRLVIDERDKREKIVSSSIEDHSFGQITCEAIVLHSNVQPNEFIRRKPVIFSLNGQVHAHLGATFISKELGFPLLKQSMLIHIDCTQIKTSFRQDLFKGSRDRFNEGHKTAYLMDKIKDLLKNDDTLKEIHQARKNMLLRNNAGDDELLLDMVANLPIDKELLDMLKMDGTLNFLKRFRNGQEDKSSSRKLKEKQKNISRRYPSIFQVKLRENNQGRKIKTIPLNGKGVIEFETDVEDEYLFRPKDKGELKLHLLKLGQNDVKGGDRAGKPSDLDDIFSITKVGPSDQTIKITFRPKENLSVGDEIEISTMLTSPGEDLECIFWVKIENPQKEKKSQDENKDKERPSLPKPIKVFEKNDNGNLGATWSEYNWTGDDIVKVVEDSSSSTGKINIEAIAINMDSFVLKRRLSKLKNADSSQIKMVKDKYFLLVYLHSLFLYTTMSNIKRYDEDTAEDEDVDEKISKIFKGYSPFLIAFDTNEAVLNAVAVD